MFRLQESTVPDPVRPARPVKSICPPEQEAALLAAIREGNYHVTACRLAGVAWRAFQDWYARGEADDTGPYRDLVDAVNRAEAEAEATSVKTLRVAGERDWRANAAWLARRHPQRWSEQGPRREVGEGGVTINVGIALTGNTPAEALPAKVWTTVPQLDDEG